MEIRYPVDGQFGREFPAICNHNGVRMAWSRKTWNFFKAIFAFFGNILFQKFTWRHRSTLLCSNVVKYVWWEIDEIVRYLPHKKKQQNFRSLSNCLYCAGRAKNVPRPAPNIWLTLFQISSKSVHFRWSYSRTREGRFWPIEYMHDSPQIHSSRINIA